MQQNDFKELKKLMVEGQIDGDDLRKRYELYSSIDDGKAMELLREKTDVSLSSLPMGKPNRIATKRHLWSAGVPARIAAAIALIIVGGALVWYAQYTKVTPPELSPEVLAAMQQSQQSGHVGASLTPIPSPKGEGRDNLQEQNTADKHATPLSLWDGDGGEAGDEFSLLHAQRVTTYHDKEFWLTLDDGTLVHLNYNTRVIYPEKFGSKKREVILDGEAYFMVAKDRSRPFIVHTPSGDVKVYGTEFYISTKADDTSNSSTRQLVNSSTTITLIKGSVGVTPIGGTEQRMQPGQQCSILNAQCSMENVDIEPYVAWNTGQFSFRSWTLERIMDVMARWHGCEVEYATDDIRRLSLSGNFNRYDGIQPTIESLEEVTGLRFTLRGSKIRIEK